MGLPMLSQQKQEKVNLGNALLEASIRLAMAQVKSKGFYSDSDDKKFLTFPVKHMPLDFCAVCFSHVEQGNPTGFCVNDIQELQHKHEIGERPSSTTRASC